MTKFKTIDDINRFLLICEADEAEPVNSDKQVMKKGEVTAEKIIDKLNTIRSGKSFRDAEIKSSLQEYIDSLKKPEKIALFAFLKGIAQIVTGEIIGDAAVEPSDPAPAISMKKATVKKVIKPTIIKKRASEEGEEDTSPPAPIKPKK
jgi:hypothetical protein